MSRQQAVQQLWRQRQRSKLVRLTFALIILASAWVWIFSDITFNDLLTERRINNWQRFWTKDVTPDAPNGMFAWLTEQMNNYGWRALASTLAISVCAITLAGLGGMLLSFGAARTIGGLQPSRFSPLVRALCIVLRALPEFVLAFLLLAVFGANAWPAILALAIHNAGILGRLGGEVVENLPRRPLQALDALGASRAQLASNAVFPMGLGRYLLYFFYRFETCVREATILGMLGVVSIGYYVVEARAHNDYDQMLLLIALGAVLVLLADIISDIARKHLQ
ncbi:MAG: ABC transporter permease subunit [Planctomycetes bacterium]|nr:ABC transporter permease subunit [Planctomycetota bacterium]